MARRLGVLVFCAVLLGSFYLYTAFQREERYRSLIVQGDSALGHDQTFHAIEAYSGAIALKPAAMLGYLKRGETYRRRGESAAALRDLKHALDLGPTATRPQEAIGDLLFDGGRYARAAEHYAAYVRLDDRAPRVLYKLAAARYRAGDADGAVSALSAAIGLDERFPEAHYLLGIILRGRNDDARAERELRRALALQPSLIPAKEELAEIFRSAGRNDEALAIDQELLAAAPGSARQQVAVGEQFARMGHADDAIVALSRALEINPEYPLLYYKIGRLWLQIAAKTGDRIALNKAVAALDTAAQRAPQNSAVLATLADAEFRAGDRRRAEQTLATAVAAVPTDPAALRFAADLARRQGRLNDARETLRRYELVAGPSADVDAQVGDLSAALGDLPVAVSAYRRAVERHPDDAALRPLLIQALMRSGQRDEAIAACRSALERSPASDTLKRLLVRLSSSD